jgi:uroporphyrinogen-III synthase
MTPGRPLSGRRVIVTRGAEKADVLATLLTGAGATVVAVPMITSERLPGADGLGAAVARLRRGAGAAWVALTSEVAVDLLAAEAGDHGLAGVGVAVVGPATAAAALRHGLAAAVVAPGRVAESLAAELSRRVGRGDRVLIVAAAGGRDVIAPALREVGAEVEVVVAYDSVVPDGAASGIVAALAAGPVDAITFTSGSTVRHFAQALGGAPPPACLAACIGPVTARAARQAGWSTVITAAEHTGAGLADALIERLHDAHPLP